MKSHNRKVVKEIFGIIITIAAFVLLIVTAQNIDWHGVLTTKIYPEFCVLSVLVFMCNIIFRGLVSKYAVKDYLSVFEVLYTEAIENVLTMVLPLRAGEAARVALLPQRLPLSVRVRLMTAPFVMDMVSVMCLALTSVFVSSFSEPQIRSNILFYLSIIFGAIGIIALVALFVPNLRHKLIIFVPEPHILPFVFDILGWLSIYASTSLALCALGFPLLDGFKIGLLVVVVSNMAVLIPSSPGAVGIFEYAVVIALSQYGFSFEFSFACGVMIHILQYVGVLPLGLIFYLGGLKKYGLPLNFLRKHKQNLPPEE